MNATDAAVLLGMKPTEIVAVDGDEVTTIDGVVYVVADGHATVKTAPVPLVVHDDPTAAEPVAEAVLEPEPEPKVKPARGRKADTDGE